MYFKITDKDSEIYKKLHAFRSNELRINKENREKISNFIKHDWDGFRGYSSQQSVFRTIRYEGFYFTHPKDLDSKEWILRKHPNGNEYHIPNKRTKQGKKIQAFLDTLETSSLDELKDILGIEDFSMVIYYPYLDIVNDTILLYIDDMMVSDVINRYCTEITHFEFNDIRYTPTKKIIMKSIFGTEIPENTKGILYLCDYNHQDMLLVPRREVFFENAFDCLNAYANTRNPASVMACETKDKSFEENLEILHKNMIDPEWQEMFGDTL